MRRRQWRPSLVAERLCAQFRNSRSLSGGTDRGWVVLTVRPPGSLRAVYETSVCFVLRVRHQGRVWNSRPSRVMTHTRYQASCGGSLPFGRTDLFLGALGCLAVMWRVGPAVASLQWRPL